MDGYRPQTTLQLADMRWFYSKEEIERSRHEMFNKHVVKRINDGIESMFALNKKYAATEHFFKMSESDDPAIKGKADEMHSRLQHMYNKVDALMKEMETEKEAIAGVLEDAQVELTRKEGWWKSAAGTSHVRPCFKDRNPPKDISYAAEITRSMRVTNAPNPRRRRRGLDVKRFLLHLDQETKYISSMQPGGYKAAFDLYLDTKLNTLQVSVATGLDAYDKQPLKQHESIDVTLAEMLREYGTQPTDEAKYYVDAGRACRDVWARMTRKECTTFGGHPCVFDMLLQTLDTLQRRAYEEINLKVLTAVGSPS